MAIVYTEVIKEDSVERWFYGRYSTVARANDVAYELGADYPYFHCVCEDYEAEKLGIKNMP